MLFLTLLGWFIALFWLWHGGVVLHFLQQNNLVKIARDLPLVDHYPKISIIVPARDEQTAIHTALSSLLALDYPHFEVIAINDRSSDLTGVMMDELAHSSPQLKVLHIETLPKGWLGKPHAMHLGVQAATGDYLIFTDGDVIYSPDALQHVMQVVIGQQWDHLALLPKLLAGDYAENSVTQFMGLIFIALLYPFRISNLKSSCYAGVGSFNLLRRSCYEDIGGFAKLRLNVVEDMALGRRVKHHGFRSQLLIADKTLQVRWQQGVNALIKGIEKNSFAALNYSLVRLLLFTLVFTVIILLPYWAIVALPFQAALGFSTAFLLLHTLYAYWGFKAEVGWKITFALLFAASVTLFAIWRSAFLTLKQGGIYWRDTFYPLSLLKSK